MLTFGQLLVSRSGTARLGDTQALSDFDTVAHRDLPSRALSFNHIRTPSPLSESGILDGECAARVAVLGIVRRGLLGRAGNARLRRKRRHPCAEGPLRIARRVEYFLRGGVVWKGVPTHRVRGAEILRAGTAWQRAPQIQEACRRSAAEPDCPSYERPFPASGRHRPPHPVRDGHRLLFVFGSLAVVNMVFLVDSAPRP